MTSETYYPLSPDLWHSFQLNIQLMQMVFPIAESALQTVHHCETKKEGDWTVYTCKRCPTYERKINTATGQVVITGSRFFSVDHVCEQQRTKRM